MVWGALGTLRCAFFKLRLFDLQYCISLGVQQNDSYIYIFFFHYRLLDDI